ncbi:MAG TPA: ABC transporter permease, partial [Baekduia sp.]|nr:ABC transporter permease [Baekduia sp.]
MSAKAPPYLTYAGRRLLQAAAVILLAYVITFLVLSVIGNNPIASQLSNPQSGLDPATIHKLESYYGVDRPLTEQLVTDVGRFVRGQFGISLQNRLPVGEQIRTALPYTLKLASLALALSLLFAGVLAFASQRFPLRWGRELARSVPSLLLSVPNFVIGLLLIHIFSFRLHAFNVLEPDNVVGTLCAAVALAVPISAPLSEVLIANLDNEASQEYVLVARSRGLSEAGIFLRHLVKPSSLPAVTMAAIIVGELMGGALITEEVFGRTGVGTLMYHA